MSENRLTEVRPGLWIDAGLVTVPTGDPVEDARRNMGVAAERYSLPQKVVVGGMSEGGAA